MRTYEGIHNSPAAMTEISHRGKFGGIFASANGGMYGSFRYVVASPRHLTNFELNYVVEGAWDAAVELCDGDEALAEIIMTPGCETDDAESGWDAQRLRGQLAAKLGYTSVEMADEMGTRCCVCRAAHLDRWSDKSRKPPPKRGREVVGNSGVGER